MKIEISPIERGYVANLLRRRSMEARDNSVQTKSDRQRVEFEEEAKTAESLAIRFDEGEELQTDSKTPIVPRSNADTNYLHEAIPEGKGAPEREAEHTPRRSVTPRRAVGSDVKSDAEVGGGVATAARHAQS